MFAIWCPGCITFAALPIRENAVRFIPTTVSMDLCRLVWISSSICGALNWPCWMQGVISFPTLLYRALPSPVITTILFMLHVPLIAVAARWRAQQESCQPAEQRKAGVSPEQ